VRSDIRSHANKDPGSSHISSTMSVETITVPLSGYDLVMPKLYVKCILYFALKPDVDPQKAYTRLMAGLSRTFDKIPALDAKIFLRPEHEPGWKKGHLQIRYPKNRDLLPSEERERPRQFSFRDQTHVLPSYEDLRSAGFEFSAFKDEAVLDTPWFPPLPADIFIAQANLIEGGLLLAMGFHHSVFDATGVFTVIKAWGECCRSMEQGLSEFCTWFDPLSLDQGILERLWKTEGYRRPPAEIDRSVWQYLGFAAPDEDNPDESSEKVNGVPPGENGATTVSEASTEKSVAPSAPTRMLETSIFYISPSKLAELKREAGVGTEVDGASLTANDAILALFWSAIIRARMRVAQDAGRIITPDEPSSLESPMDARSFFSDALPRTYLGNAVMISRCSMPLLTLTAPYSQTSLKDIAACVRRAAARIDIQLVHDAYTLLETVPDYTALKYAFMETNSLDVMISSTLLLPLQELAFGGEFFEDDGCPELFRPLMDGLNSGFRLCVVLPMTRSGGVRLLVGLFPEELEVMLNDKEFEKYALFLCQ